MHRNDTSLHGGHKLSQEVFVLGTQTIRVRQRVSRNDARRIFCLRDLPLPKKIYAPATLSADFFLAHSG